MWTSVIIHQRHQNATANAIRHVYCFVEYSVLTMQLPQHWSWKTKHHFPYTIVPTLQEWKQLHERDHSSHESEMFPTTNPTLIKVISCFKSFSLNEYDLQIISSVFFMIEIYDLPDKELKYAKELLLNHYRKSVKNSKRLQDLWVELKL